MKLKKYIEDTIQTLNDITSELEFDIGVDSNMEVNPNSPNRVKFKVGKKKPTEIFE